MGDELKPRDIMAASVIASWDRDTDYEWGARFLRNCRDGKHMGDCTKHPCACLRCQCDEALEDADKIIRALKSSGWQLLKPQPDSAAGEG